jgi:neutral ceramidase
MRLTCLVVGPGRVSIVWAVLLVLYLGSVCTDRLAAAESTSAPPLHVGTAVVEITPEEGKVHDPLLAKVLFFRQEGCQAALVVCDQIGVSPGLTSEVRRKAAEETGMPAAHVAITASHTHTGRAACQDVAQRLVGAIAKAQAGAAPVRLLSGTVNQQETISFNRRYLMKDGTIRFNPGFLNPDIVRPVGPIDPQLGIVLLRKPDGEKPSASLVSFALHLDTVGKYTELSADYPFYLAELLKQELGEDFVSVFGTGTCGDVNHFDVSRPRQGWTGNIGQTMLLPYKPKPTTASPSPLNAPYIGQALAKTVAAAMPELKDDVPCLAVRSRTVQTPLAAFSEMDLAWAKEASGGQMSFLMRVRAGRIRSLESLRAKYGDAMPVEVQVFRLGSNTAVVTLPGEVFVEHGLAIKKASPFANTLVIELANSDEMHYVPTRKAFCEGDYEVVNSRLESGGGEMMVEAAVGMLNELRAGAK